MKRFIAAAATLAILIAGAALWSAAATGMGKAASLQAFAPRDARLAALADFFNENLGVLSPVKPSLGGHFFVTDVTAADGSGIVAYEDGHNAYAADFLYSESGGSLRVESFKMRE
jgi:hypothetical protein